MLANLETRMLVAYALIILMIFATIAVIALVRRKRAARRHREIMRHYIH